MNSILTIVIAVFLFSSFSHCRAAKKPLKCHQCISRKGSNKSCEVGDESNVKPCPPTKSSYCMSVRSIDPMYRESILRRDCVDEKPANCGSGDASRKGGLDACPLLCQADACNGGEPGTISPSSPGYDRPNLQGNNPSTQYTPYGSSTYNQQYQQMPGSQTQYPGQQSGGQHGKPTSGQTNNQYGNPTQYQGGYGSTSQQNGYGQPGQRPYGSQYGTQYGQQPGSDYYGNHGYNLRRSPNYFEVGKLILLLLMMRNQEQFQRQVG